MGTVYPTAKDNFVILYDTTDDVMAAHPNDRADAVVALQTKIGVDSSTVDTTIDYFLKHASGAFRTHIHDGTSDDGSATLSPTTINAFSLGGKLTAGANEIECSNVDITGGSITGITDLAVIDGGTGLSSMTGMIQMYGGTSAPTGWLACNGAAVSTTTYSALYAVIGVTYGNPGGGNFNLPNLVSKFARGSATPGTGAGSDTFSLEIAEANLPIHSHGAGTLTGGSHSHILGYGYGGGDNISGYPEPPYNSVFGGWSTDSTNSGGAVAVTGSTGEIGSGTVKSIDTVPAYTSVMYIIKI